MMAKHDTTMPPILHVVYTKRTGAGFTKWTSRFRRASRGGEAMARRRKDERRAGTASRGIGCDEVVSPPVCGHRGVPAHGGVPERCHASGAVVDARCDTSTRVRWAERTAD